jgi:hypothetical protein
METFVWGFFGGVAAELAVLFGLRKQFPGKYPHWVVSPAYWAIVVVMAACGGAIALAYVRSGTALTAILAIQVGASAPLFLRKARDLLSEPPKPPNQSTID